MSCTANRSTYCSNPIVLTTSPHSTPTMRTTHCSNHCSSTTTLTNLPLLSPNNAHPFRSNYRPNHLFTKYPDPTTCTTYHPNYCSNSVALTTLTIHKPTKRITHRSDYRSTLTAPTIDRKSTRLNSSHRT